LPAKHSAPENNEVGPAHDTDSLPEGISFLIFRMQPKWPSFIAGLLILFVIYHFPEFFSALWIAAVFKIGFLIAAFLLARWQGWKGLGGYGLVLHKGWIKNLLFGLVIGIAFFVLAEWLSIISGYEKLFSIATVAAIVNLLPLTLVMTFFPSIAEDILTRGYLYGHLKNRLKPAAFILVSALFYVLNHIWRLSEGAAVLSYLFVLGLALAWALWYTKSLWLTLGMHWGANIAFEMINSGTSTETVNKAMSTWILAGCFGLMWMVTILFRKIFFVSVAGGLPNDLHSR
jgi:membrane protease YdiL (CAAX protease family)